MSAKYQGIWPALLTPLKENGSLWFESLEALVDLFANQGLSGLYVGGSTGQWLSLATEERESLLKKVVEVAAGRFPVMAHVGATTTAEAVRLARHAEAVGADAISAVAPVYYPHSTDAVFRHYRAIGEAARLPLFVYHLNVAQQLAIGPREYVKRLLELPNIAGMKITDRDTYMFGLMTAYSSGKLTLFSGADEVMGHAVLCGAVGAIGTFYNVWGPACARAREGIERGEVAKGRAFMLRFQTALDEVLSSGGVWSFLRAAMLRKYRIDVGMPRPPLGAVDLPWTEADTDRLIHSVDTAWNDPS